LKNLNQINMGIDTRSEHADLTVEQEREWDLHLAAIREEQRNYARAITEGLLELGEYRQSLSPALEDDEDLDSDELAA
jgi:hypothetical protein